MRYCRGRSGGEAVPVQCLLILVVLSVELERWGQVVGMVSQLRISMPERGTGIEARSTRTSSGLV